jgi:cytoskeleton protein RodZ
VDAHAESQVRSPGRILATERERQGLEPADIAQRLHMSVSQVEALERDEYVRLPRGTFLRGFVRNYAKILGLPPDDVLKRLAEGAPRDPAPRIVVPSQNIRFDPLSERIANPYVKAAGIAAAVIAFGFAGMYWWMFIRNAPQGAPAAKKNPATASATLAPRQPEAPRPAAPIAEPPRAELPKPEPAKLEPQKPEPAKAAKAEAVKVASTKPEPPKADGFRMEPPKALAEPAKGDATKLTFRFRGQSWVEIKDARGKVLMTGLNDPGSEAEVSGRPPFRVVVGNAPEVKMFLNDREYNLEPHMREAVARLTVE